jgi:hypothetical protein
MSLVTACPSCTTPVAVPADFLGKVVHCVRCKATFTAPAAAGESPTLIRRGRLSTFLLVPTVSLLLLGTAGLFVNGYLLARFNADPAAADTFARGLLREIAANDPPNAKELAKLDPAEQAARREQFVADQERKLDAATPDYSKWVQWLQLPGLLTSGVVLLGGLAFALRKPYWLAFVGCLAAAVNVNHACCVPGFVAGLWGFLAAISDEGRRHFQKG